MNKSRVSDMDVEEYPLWKYIEKGSCLAHISATMNASLFFPTGYEGTSFYILQPIYLHKQTSLHFNFNKVVYFTTQMLADKPVLTS